MELRAFSQCKCFPVFVGVAVSCSAQGKRHGSSVPLRYFPKKSRQQDENFTKKYEVNSNSVDASGDRRFLPSDHTSIRFNGPEFNLGNRNFLEIESQDDDLGCSSAWVDSLHSETEEELDVNSPTEDGEYGTPLNEHRQVAEDMAIRLLASRAFTAFELRRKLQGKRFSVNIVDAVISDFQSRGLINDSLYAEAYCQSRWSSSSWGPGKIKQGLLRKGVSVTDAHRAIELFFKNNKEEDDDLGTSRSRVSIDQIYVQASKQWQRSIGAPTEIRKSRIVRWLMYRGFNWGVVGSILKKLESSSSL